MKIPTFWARGTAEGSSAEGRPVVFSCWRASDTSEADAQASALAAAKRVLAVLLSGRKPDRYGYACVPLREEVLNRVEDEDGNPVAVVTRNGYGSLVLNAERVMFVDIDFAPVAPGEALANFFGRLFGLAKGSPDTLREEKARADLAGFLAGRPGWGLRLYRTCAGMRAIVTHDVFDPKSEASLNVLRSMGSDALYVRLCKAQECFRARLTPKPWRCGHYANPARWPFDDGRSAQQFQKWDASYQSLQREYVTCRFVGQMGSQEVHPEVGRIVELHDFVTRCTERLPLA